MSKTYTPGPEADEIIAGEIAKGHYASGDEVVRAGVRMLAEQEQEIAYLRQVIDEGDADIAGGRVRQYANGADLAREVAEQGASRSDRKP